MASKPFITMNVGQVRSQIEKIVGTMEDLERKILEATKQAIAEVAELMLAEAQSKIHTMSGDLEASATALPIEVSGEEVSIRWGFNKEYARIQDQGGTILPVKAQLLAIPLSPIMTATGPQYPSPRAEGDNLELVPILNYLFLADKTTGEFHWLLTDQVTLKGSGYVTRTVQEMNEKLPELISNRIAALLSAGTAPGTSQP